MRERAKIWAAVGTVAFHAVVLVILLCTFLRYPPKDPADFPEAPEQFVVFEPVEELYTRGEPVRRGDLPDALPVNHDEPAPSPVADNRPSQDAVDTEDAGHAAAPRPTVTSERPSPAKVKKEQKGPTKEQLRAERERQEAQERAQAKKNAEAATRRAFGGSGKGQAGQTDGNATQGAATGTPGNGVHGRTLESFGRVSATKTGEITIRVTVDAQGHVTSAVYVPSGSSGAVAADTRMRQACVQRSLQCRFSVLEGSPSQSGTIVWRFK